MTETLSIKRRAFFPHAGVRGSLSRDWGTGPRAVVIGCNPSSAGADRDDATCRWWIDWFSRHGFGGFDAVNLYPFVTPIPFECRQRANAALKGENYGDRDDLFANLDTIVRYAKQADQVFTCWGAIAWDRDWADHVVEHIQTGVAPYPDLWCWAFTSNGAPRHPLARGKHRIDPAQEPILWRAA